MASDSQQSATPRHETLLKPSVSSETEASDPCEAPKKTTLDKGNKRTNPFYLYSFAYWAKPNCIFAQNSPPSSTAQVAPSPPSRQRFPSQLPRNATKSQAFWKFLLRELRIEVDSNERECGMPLKVKTGRKIWTCVFCGSWLLLHTKIWIPCVLAISQAKQTHPTCLLHRKRHLHRRLRQQRSRRSWRSHRRRWRRRRPGRLLVERNHHRQAAAFIGCLRSSFHDLKSQTLISLHKLSKKTNVIRPYISSSSFLQRNASPFLHDIPLLCKSQWNSGANWHVTSSFSPLPKNAQASCSSTSRNPRLLLSSCAGAAASGAWAPKMESFWAKPWSSGSWVNVVLFWKISALFPHFLGGKMMKNLYWCWPSLVCFLDFPSFLCCFLCFVLLVFFGDCPFLLCFFVSLLLVMFGHVVGQTGFWDPRKMTQLVRKCKLSNQ